MAFDLVRILEALATQRPVFHSEADFQHALAWIIHEKHPAAKVRLEYRPRKLKEKAYIDIWAELHGATYAVELKYKTRSLQETVSEETFSLLNQSAQDQARYDFCRDIGRIETLAAAYPELIGFAVFLTNDRGYWRVSGRDGNVDSAFRVHEDAKLSGKLEWALHASKGTKSGRVNAICLAGEYSLNWMIYSTCGNGRNNEFRVAVVNTMSVGVAQTETTTL